MQKAVPLHSVRTRRVSPMRRQEAWLAALLILPSTLGIVIFAVLPIAASLGISLTDWGGLSRPNVVGFQNYAAACRTPAPPAPCPTPCCTCCWPCRPAS